MVYNAQRTTTKKPLIAGKTEVKYPAAEHIQLRVFETEEEEAAGIAQEILARGRSIWGETTVLARTRALLERMHKALQESQVPSVISQRRDDFLSPEFRWLAAGLRQIARPLDRRNVTVLVEAFNRLTGTEVSVEQVITDAETTGRGYLITWLETASRQQNLLSSAANLLTLLSPCAGDPSAIKVAIEAIVGEFGQKLAGPGSESDLEEDMAAWKELTRDIAGYIGKNAPLEQFLQELQLRSKEPTPKSDTVALMTIHGAKGREFDCVYVIGLAEDVMPSFQSKQKGDRSAQMEEERRNCFVAITRTKECLGLSRAENYRGWHKEPSRFLVEMGLVENEK